MGYNDDDWYENQWVDNEAEEGLYEYYQYEEILQETGKARLFKLVGIADEIWIPTSLSDIIYADNNFDVPEVGVPGWFAESKGIS